jgi:hypothetical protein
MVPTQWTVGLNGLHPHGLVEKRASEGLPDTRRRRLFRHNENSRDMMKTIFHLTPVGKALVLSGLISRSRENPGYDSGENVWRAGIDFGRRRVFREYNQPITVGQTKQASAIDASEQPSRVLSSTGRMSSTQAAATTQSLAIWGASRLAETSGRGN